MIERENGERKPLLRTPTEWIERRLEQTAPDLSRTALDALSAEHRSLLSVSEQLKCDLLISYFPNSISDHAARVGVSADSLLPLLQADLREGIAVKSWRNNQGRTMVSVLGAQWRLDLRPKKGNKTGATLALLEEVQRIEIPTRLQRFESDSIYFQPVWDEVPCDLFHVTEQYRICRRSLDDAHEEARALRRRIDECRERRKDTFGRTLRELQRGQADATIQTRSETHALVRRQYSALQVMMELLQVRSTHDKTSFPAVVVQPVAASNDNPVAMGGDSFQHNVPSETEGEYLRVRLHDPLPAGILDEETLIELEHSERVRPRRARVLAVTTTDGKPIVQLDLDASFLSPGAEVIVHTVARFGMWAHQRAVHDLFDENVHGHWFDLARLCCSPAQLAVTEPHTAPARFFCDTDAKTPSLNERQRLAVAGALATPHTFCIQGPPGTGKTTVICELVRQLIARGERILLVAPTHVAVDEVLRRIGSKAGVRALRLSWDDARVAEDVRKFTPTNIIDPFIERVQQLSADRTTPWQLERESIDDALVRVLALRYGRQQRIAGETQCERAERALQEARSSLDAEQLDLKNRIQDYGKRLAAAEAGIAQREQELRDVVATREAILSKAGWTKRALGIVGLGEVARSGKRLRAVTQELEREKIASEEIGRSKQAAEKRLDALKTAVAETERIAAAAATALSEARHEERELLQKCTRHDLLLEQALAVDPLETVIAELRDRDGRLAGYQKLAARFDELILEARREGEDLDGLRRDLLAVTNLFCCTTTGVAGSQELKELVFDTLIVDEASRVTDSEFLIGATRAKRWILVGDEHQLPPYVEQNDEHFIHALSALHQTGAAEIELNRAVDELGLLWEEDEELHQFRRANVLSVAERLRDSGHWESHYRDAYQTGIERLRQEVDDPSRALLRAMRDNLIYSLFERVVAACPSSMRVRLVEQRRMIEPLAAIVSQPVYGGDYATPSAEILAALSPPVIPLTTPSFPTPVTFIDTSQYGLRARDELNRNSFRNPFEADRIVQACVTLDRELSQAGSGPVTVSILAFYKAQARLIREKLEHYSESGKRRFVCLRFSVIDAIDRIQGQESDVVFLSFCRTAGKNVGPGFGQWLQDVRRLNVACTRAHRALVFVGQKELLAKLCASNQARLFYRHLNDLFGGRPDVMRVVSQFGK